MQLPPPKSTRPASLRPEYTAKITAETGLSDEVLTKVVHSFYAKVRADALLGPIFNTRISDWDTHLAKLVDFWSSVVLMSGRYHGQPMPAHMPLPIDGAHFERWLALFDQTVTTLCTGEGAALLNARAGMIAGAIQSNLNRQRHSA
ncbi:MAG: group III truncated hemoglobin [Rhodobacteraceae bacterium]|nr:group III truncated hemoglobin [Paracoccaceae bacterium]